ncbi:Ataxin-10 [Linderina pennispora]|nr:Ataxin-10 [Linderina pennispora]
MDEENLNHQVLERLVVFRDKCAQLRLNSPHPSRPHISTVVGSAVWTEIKALFDLSDIGSLEDTHDTLTAIRSEGLCDLCIFIRNSAAMNKANQDSAFDAGILAYISRIIHQLVVREITCPEAMRCVSFAAQALSNIATGNKKVQHSLFETELAPSASPMNTMIWYLLASVNSKTNMACLVLILNSIKDDLPATELLCQSDAGQLVVSKIGEMFGENEDDESELKNVLYAVLDQVISAGQLPSIIGSEVSVEQYGLLDALAVFCNENKNQQLATAITLDQVRIITTLLTQIEALLVDIWEVTAEVYNISSNSDMEMDGVVDTHRSFSALVSILGTVTELGDASMTGMLVEQKTLHSIVRLLGLLNRHLPRIERASEQEAKAASGETDSSVARLFMFKRDLIRIISNAAHRNVQVQDLMRELDGLALVLDHMRIDENHPYIKEHAVVAVRNLLEGNQANQDYVSKMSAMEMAHDPQLEKAGVTATVGDDGKVSISPADSENIAKKQRRS